MMRACEVTKADSVEADEGEVQAIKVAPVTFNVIEYQRRYHNENECCHEKVGDSLTPSSQTPFASSLGVECLDDKCNNLLQGDKSQW